MEKQEEVLREESIDIKSFIYKLIANWHLFVFSIAIAFSVSFIYLRYTQPIYNASGTILIRDKNNQKLGAENLLQGLELFSNRKNLENEIEILGSYSLVNKTVKKLNFGISYYSEGNVRHAELYKDCPFIVLVDSLHPQIPNIPFYISLNRDSSFLLNVKIDEAKTYIPFTEQNGNIIQNFQLNKKYKLGDTCSTPYFSFRVEKNSGIVNFNRLVNERLYFIIHKADDVTRNYIGKLDIKPMSEKSSVVKLEVKGPVVDKEIDFINQLSFEYIQSDLDEKNKIATNTIKFIDEQLIEISRSLIGAEAELEKYRQSNQIMNLDFSSTSAFERLLILDNEKAELLVKDKYYKYLLGYINENTDFNNIVAPSSMGISDPLLISLINDLNQYYSQKAVLGFSAEDENPSVYMLNQKIKNAKETLVENVKNILNSSKISLEALNQRIKETEALIKDLPKKERDLVSIQRQFNLNDHIYNYLLEKRAEAGIAKAANTPDNKILDLARIDGRNPISPKKALTFTIAFILAIFFPGMYIAIKTFFYNKIEHKEHLLKLSDIPLLGVVGHNTKQSVTPLIDFPKSIVSESFRSLRINLQYLRNDSSTTKIIGITSSISGEGKTFCALNLSSAIAISGARTILIGADLRKPKLNKVLSISNDIGLSSYLIQKNTVDEIIQKTPVPNLDVIPAGPVPPNPSELLGRQEMNDLIEYLKKDYDYIIIDTPPIALVSDYFILKRYIDAHLFIVRNRYTSNKALEGINEVYKRKELTNLFLVLNDVKPGLGSGYGYGYAYGYAYGYGYSYGYGNGNGYYDDTSEKSPLWKRILGFGRKKESN